MSTTKLTERTIFEAIANDTLQELNYLEVAAWAKRKLEQLDKKNAKARERAAAKKAEGDELMETVFDALSEEFEPAVNILNRIEGDDLTVAKVQNRLSRLVKDGRAEKEDIKVEDEDGKKRTLKGYRRA